MSHKHSVKLKQINQQYVTAIPIPDEDKRPIKGYDICEEVYANIFLCAKKKSGKTSALFKIMKECSNKSTVLIVFCSTAYKDKNWIQIRKYFKKKKMDIRVYTSIYEDGEDQLSNLIEDLKADAKDEEDAKEAKEDEEPEEELDRCDDILKRLTNMHLCSIGRGHEVPEEEREDHKKKKKKKDKYLAPEYIIIFDDLSSELQSRSLLSLMKFNRHFKSKLIISSQWLHDLLPESRKQLDLFLIFKGFPEDKMKLIYKDCDSGIPFDTFYDIYKKATKRPHSFMYIDTRADEFRRNFDCKFILNLDDDSENDDNDSQI